jgi:predicted MFS family arabinose efflux permease
MVVEPNLALRRARRTGLVICVVSALLALVFLAGVLRQSYWAVALPVALGVLLVLGLAFSIGYTINTVRGIPDEAEHYDGRGARRIALGICVAAVLLGLVFVAFVLQGSYWALAIPVAVAVLGFLFMVFMIGWAIVMQKTTLPPPVPAPRERGDA